MPTPLVSGDPMFITWPPQMMHLVPTASGVHYYLCRPMGELLPIMEYLREQLGEWLRQLREMMKRFPELRPVIEPVLEPAYRLARAIGEALEAAAAYAWDHFWEIMLVVAVIVAVVVIVVFAAEILAAIAAIGTAIMAAVEAVLAALSAAAWAFAALLTLFGLTSAAAASEPEAAPVAASPEPSPSADPGCFVRNTAILRADGVSVAIVDIGVGDEVLAWDETHGTLLPRAVVATHEHPPEPLVELVLSNGRRLVVTRLHTVRAADRWVLVRDLRAGDRVLSTADGQLQAVRVLEVGSSPRREPVYNLTVEDCETYVAEGVVVHNMGIAKGRPAPIPSPNAERP